MSSTRDLDRWFLHPQAARMADGLLLMGCATKNTKDPHAEDAKELLFRAFPDESPDDLIVPVELLQAHIGAAARLHLDHDEDRGMVLGIQAADGSEPGKALDAILRAVHMAAIKQLGTVHLLPIQWEST